MAHTTSYTFFLTGSPNTGQVPNLSAQYIDTTGATSSPSGGSFLELGAGWYMFTDTATVDGFRGSVVFKLTGAIKAGASINPQELENADIRTSSINPAGSGPNQVTITLARSGGGIVAGAQVVIKDNAQTTILAYGNTDINGVVVFNLPAGTAKVLVNAGIAYVALATQTLVISGTTAATYTLTPQAITPPTDPATCRVFGYLKYPDLSIAVGVQVRFRLRGESAVVTGGRLIALVFDAIATTDNTGYFQIDLVRSDQLTADDTGYDATCSVLRLNKVLTLTSSTFDLSTVPIP